MCNKMGPVPVTLFSATASGLTFSGEFDKVTPLFAFVVPVPENTSTVAFYSVQKLDIVTAYALDPATRCHI